MKLEYLPPEPLLRTSGYSWDYQKSDDLRELLRTTITEYYKICIKQQLDKSTTPLFFMIAGAGEGKSRNANELPNILHEEFASHKELKKRFENALIFNISLENDTKIDLLEEHSAVTAIAKRMLFQLEKRKVLNNFAASGPFVIGCCTTTLSRPFHVFMSASHQKRVDMGGHGRALEALNEALNDNDLDKVSFLTIMEGVYAKLSDLYNEWINQTSYLKPILCIILTQVIVEANKDPTLQSWNFKYYQEVQHNEDLLVPPGCQYWQHFEEFIGRIRVLKSQVFDPNQHVDLKEIHSGAWHNFEDIKIINKALTLEKATVWTSTKSSCGTRTVQCEKVNVQLAEASHCIINKPNAPYGDCFCPIYIANSQNFCIESHQCKLIKASAAINEQLFMEEYNKAAEPGTDVFIFFTTGKCDISSLPPRSAIVDSKVWNSYFGPFSGRAFIYSQQNPPNINKAVYTVLTAITGIGTKHADVIMDERKKVNLQILKIVIDEQKYQKMY
ncbi:13451_t:CDS:2 [Entrophospora sp. SA101]|nr:13451_t:CDS:2 [Entrophospora sp. SA101]